MVEPPSDLIQSVSRALRVLEAVGASPQGCNAKTVAARTGLHLSTVYHLLRTLAYEGYLCRTETGDYRVGLEIADRFRDLQARLARPPRVDAVLRTLAERTGHSAYLARFVDGQVAITAVVEAPGSPHLEDLVPGFDEAAHATAVGKALLSTLSADDRQRFLQEAGLRPFTPSTVCDAQQLEHELATTGDGAVFVERGQFRGPVSCAATLVATGQAREPWWAIALSAATPVMLRRQHDLVAQLRTASRDLATAA